MIFLLLLPGAEVYTLFRFFESAPLAAFCYLLAACGIGWLLMRAAKVGFFETVRILMERGGHPGALLTFSKIWVVGGLLFFPGYITDLLALALLFYPADDSGKNGGGEKRQSAGRVVEIQGRVEPD